MHENKETNKSEKSEIQSYVENLGVDSNKVICK